MPHEDDCLPIVGLQERDLRRMAQVRQSAGRELREGTYLVTLRPWEPARVAGNLSRREAGVLRHCKRYDAKVRHVERLLQRWFEPQASEPK